ncbi:hypothetical protein ABZ027_31835 [Streptomyces sp. NPDC006332]|uniref:hypothetical protein n=1 Tax=Streptomyces sp. NPDC006332 TaxID=3155456 RepID=UPI0033BB4845
MATDRRHGEATDAIDLIVDELLGVPPSRMPLEEAAETMDLDYHASRKPPDEVCVHPQVERVIPAPRFDPELAIQVAVWSIQAAVSGVIGNAIYDRARSAVRRVLARARGPEEPPRVEEAEAVDIAVFACALAGIVIFPSQPANAAAYERPVSEVSRFDGRVLVRFIHTRERRAVAGQGLESIIFHWHERTFTEVLMPERGASTQDMRWRTYVRHDVLPFATFSASDWSAEDERLTQELWPRMRRELRDEEPGEWQPVPVPNP